jgi:hypothetical protein
MVPCECSHEGSTGVNQRLIGGVDGDGNANDGKDKGIQVNDGDETKKYHEKTRSGGVRCQVATGSVDD